MAAFDDAIFGNESYRQNFKGYTGNPPYTKEEYDALDCWKDASIRPTWEEISGAANIADVRNKRAIEYPSVDIQLDTLWHMMDDGTIPGKNSQWYNDIKAVKEKYPKG